MQLKLYSPMHGKAKKSMGKNIAVDSSHKVKLNVQQSVYEL